LDNITKKTFIHTPIVYATMAFMNNHTKKYTVAPKYEKHLDDTLIEYPLFMRILLSNRGIDTKEKADAFLNPNYEKHIHNPFLIKDMEKAVLRILAAIKGNEKIIIYSDYDHDGIPGGVILHDFFKKIEYENFSNYIPHRHLEGYGLHIEAIEGFAKERVALVITVDCGSSDFDAVKCANELGIDIIITDHHIMPAILPNAFAILNSKQSGDEYPYNMLCGSGVAFKLVQGLLMSGNFNITVGWEKWLLDLVAIGTIGDMVPLQGENRVLAYYGLRVLRKTQRLGLNKLLSKMKMKASNITEDDIGFMIAPRINAASRMGEPSLAFDMLATDDEITGDVRTDALEKLNNERKGMVAAMVKEIKHILEKQDVLAPIIVMGNPLWRPGLLGLACNSVMESYGRPVFLWGREGGEKLKGSCRSDGSVDLVMLMASIDKAIIIEFGGHIMAGGFSVSQEKIHLLGSVLNEQYEIIKPKFFDEKIVELDSTLLLDQVHFNTYGMIEKLAPYGIDNPKPIFLFEGIKVFGVKRFGKEANHLEIIFQSEAGKKIVAIGFFMNEKSFGEAIIEVGVKINLVASIEKSTFRNFPEIRLRIVDII
jgi:single-stranded-DNA-specific exonuclease